MDTQTVGRGWEPLWGKPQHSKAPCMGGNWWHGTHAHAITKWPSMALPPPREVPKDTSATSPWRGHAFKGLWRTSPRLGITPRFSQGLHQLGLAITQPFLVQIDQNLGR